MAVWPRGDRVGASPCPRRPRLSGNSGTRARSARGPCGRSRVSRTEAGPRRPSATVPAAKSGSGSDASTGSDASAAPATRPTRRCPWRIPCRPRPSLPILRPCARIPAAHLRRPRVRIDGHPRRPRSVNDRLRRHARAASGARGPRRCPGSETRRRPRTRDGRSRRLPRRGGIAACPRRARTPARASVGPRSEDHARPISEGAPRTDSGRAGRRHPGDVAPRDRGPRVDSAHHADGGCRCSESRDGGRNAIRRTRLGAGSRVDALRVFPLHVQPARLPVALSRAGGMVACRCSGTGRGMLPPEGFGAAIAISATRGDSDGATRPTLGATRGTPPTASTGTTRGTTTTLARRPSSRPFGTRPRRCPSSKPRTPTSNSMKAVSKAIRNRPQRKIAPGSRRDPHR
jgi:hypothetical protein